MAAPTFEQVRQIPVAIQDVVRADQIDHNGHMNVMQYYGLGNLATWEAVIDAGVTKEYTEETGLTLFHAEQHLRFIGEMHEGDAYSAHNRVVDCSERAVHAITYVLNLRTSTLAFIFEAVVLHVDLTTRRVTPFGPQVQAGFDRAVDAGRELDWDAFANGAMGVRR